MSTKKTRKICYKCGKKSIIDKLLFIDNKYYHIECAGTEKEKCPITEEFIPKWKSDFYNWNRLYAPITFLEYVNKKRHLLGKEPLKQL